MNLTRFFAALAVVAALQGSASAAVTCSVGSVELRDAFEGKQLLVRDGDRDVTRDVKYSCTNPAVAAVDDKGFVSPTGDGTCVVRIEHAAGRLDVPITVRGFTRSRPVDFRTEVMPLLSRLGCNAGGCHGKAGGQNGFRLSLFGFDAEFDHAAITREARGRRVFASNPDESPSAGTATHRGSRRTPAVRGPRE